jgi:DNA mismatch endonuclease (patch repair protein)
MKTDSEDDRRGDTLTPEQRSRLMSRVRAKNTTPEKFVRSLLHSRGYRFRLHDKSLPGSPDIVLPKYNTAIFVHGCFWHSHEGCKKATKPKQNAAYWEQKMAENVERDKRKERALLDAGWNVLVVWQCAIETLSPEELAARLDGLLHTARSGTDGRSVTGLPPAQ